jgi:hypothetical protein
LKIIQNPQLWPPLNKFDQPKQGNNYMGWHGNRNENENELLLIFVLLEMSETQV